jgi:ParB-like chromosome segregation protein Spo0J
MARQKKPAAGGRAEAAGVRAAEVPAGTEPTRLEVRSLKLSAIDVKDKGDRTRDGLFHGEVMNLAASMGKIGLRQPIGVKAAGQRFELVFGERRWYAAKLLGWEAIPATILPDDVSVVEARAAENLQRQDLNEDQKALVVSDMLDRAAETIAAEMGVKPDAELDAPTKDTIRVAAVKRLAERFGWPVQRVRDYAFVAGLPAKTRALGAEGRLSLAHLRVLAMVPDPELCDLLAEASADHGEGARMRPLEHLKSDVARLASRLDLAGWDLSVPFAGAPSCDKCPANSRNRTGLFDGCEPASYQNADSYSRAPKGPPTQGVCTNLPCFKRKDAETKAAIRRAADFIAGKAAALSPKDRPGALARLVRERQEKAPFVRPTVFGKEVRERVGAKLEKPKGASRGPARSAPAASDYDSPEARARRAAQEKHREALRGYAGKVEAVVEARLGELRPTARMLVAAAVQLTDDGVKARQYFSDKASREAADRLRVLLEFIASGGDLDEAVARVAELVVSGKGFDPFRGDWRFKTDGTLAAFALALGVDLAKLPPLPKLEDFLPKAEPAQSVASRHDGGKAKAQPAGKKKTTRKGGKAASAPAPAGAEGDEGEDA